MALGIISGSEVSTPSSGAPIDGEPFRRAALAKGRVAAAGADAAAGVMQGIADKIAQNRQARQVFDADLTMRKTYDQFTADLVNNPDEGTWLPKWKDQVAQTRDAIMENPHLGPDTKDLLNKKVDLWEQTTTSATNIAALQKGVNESWKSASNDAMYAAHQGQIDGPGGANSIMDAAVANHAGLRKDAEQLKKKFPAIAGEASANQAIERFPFDAPKVLPGLKNWNAIPYEQQRVLTNQAKAAQARAQKGTLDELTGTLSKGGSISEDDLKQLTSMGKLTETGAKEIRDSIAGKNKQISSKAADVLHMEMADHDWTNDPTPDKTKLAYREKIAGLPVENQKGLVDALDSHAKQGEEASARIEAPIKKQSVDAGKQAYKDGLFRPATIKDVPADAPEVGAFFGWGTKTAEKGGTKSKIVQPEKEKGWEDDADAKTIATAKMNAAAYRKDMEAFFEARPKASPDEAEAKSQELLGKYVGAHTRAAVAPVSQPQFQKGEVRRQGGKTYEFDGATWNEVK